MIYLARLLYLIGAAICFGGIGGAMLIYGRHGTGLIDAPHLLPWAIAGIIGGFLTCVLAVACGADIGPMGRKNAMKARAQTLVKQADVGSMTRAAYNEHIVERHLAGDPEIDFNMFDDAVHGRLRQPGLSTEEQARADRVDAIDFSTSPCRLQVIVPPVPSDSWVGGNPSMPADMDWPMIDGQPAMFYAQIAAQDLPTDIWGGNGPRTGWQIIFGPPDYTHGDAVVLHSETLGDDRPRPAGQVFRYYRYGDYDDIAQDVMGDAGLQPPKWPVRVVPADGDARPAESSYSHAGNGFAVTEPGWQPFDWVTLRMLLISLRGNVARRQKLAERRATGDESAVQIATLDDLARQLDDLVELVRQRSAQAPFTNAERDRIMGALGAVSYPPGIAKPKEAQPVLWDLGQSDYAALFDTRAKQVYAENPADLPPAVRNLLEPQWKEVAEAEVITMGGSGTKFEQDANAVILELVPSRLFSWTFGDYSNFAVMMRPDDIYDGQWDKAFAMDNHGL